MNLVTAAFIKLALLLIIFSCCKTSATNQVNGNNMTVGSSIGVVTLNKEGYGRNDLVRIYNEDGSLWYQFSYYYDNSDGDFEYANNSIRLFAFHPDYFLLALKCAGRANGRYEVVVNEETGLRKYVRDDDPALKFETWGEHVSGIIAIGFNSETNPLRKEPEGQLKSVSFTERVVFQPVEVRGDWLKIRRSGCQKRE